MKLGPYRTDASKTLEQLTGVDWGEPDSAPTHMVKTIIRAGKKPLDTLNGEEIWLLVSQQEGLPFILDLVWPLIERDPLSYFDKYEGDVLSSLLKAPEAIWAKRPEYRAELESLKQRALTAPNSMNDMFRETLAR